MANSKINDMDFTPVPVNKSSNQIENLQNLSEDCQDKESFRGVFGWMRIFKKYMVPFIVRVINGERINFISMQMAEKSSNIQKYLNFFRSDILICAVNKFQFMTHTEAKLFNEINSLHYDNHYRTFSTKDCIIRYEDLFEFYKFSKFCYETLHHNNIPNEKYGFIEIISGSVVPYIIIDGIKYIPLFCIESISGVLQIMKITDWNLSYLRFCYKILGLENYLSSSDSCNVISIDSIKRYISPETIINEIGIVDSYIGQLMNYEQANELSSARIEQYLRVPATENTTPHTSTEPVIQHRISVITGVQKMKSNQMGLLEKIQTNSSTKKSINHYRHLPSPPPALPLFPTQSNSNRVASLGLLEKIQTNSSTKKSINHYRHLPSPPPALPLFPTQSNSHRVASLGLLEKIQTNSSTKKSINHYRHLPSPPPALPLFPTQSNSHRVASLGLLEKRQANSSNKKSTNHYRHLPSPPPALPLFPTQSNSHRVASLGLLEKIQTNSSTKKSINHYRHLPSPPPALPLFPTQSNSHRVASLGLLEKIQTNSSTKKSINHYRHLPSPPPALPLFPTQSNSHRVASLGLLEKRQANSSNKKSTNHYRHLPSPPPALPLFPTQSNSHRVASLGLLEKRQANSSNKKSTNHYRHLPSPPPALPLFPTQSYSHRVASLGLLEKRQANSSNKKSTNHYRHLPSPPPALPLFPTQSYSHRVASLGLLEKRQANSSNKKSTNHYRHLPSPPPALPLFPTQSNSHRVASLGLLEKRQANSSNKKSTNHYRHLPSPPPALPLFPTQSYSHRVASLELSEIRQRSNAMNSIVKVPQLPSPSPSTSTALSILNTQRKSRTKIEMIDITTPPSSPAPNNQQEIFYTPTSAIQLKRKSEQMLNGTKELSEIRQCSNAMNSIVKVPQLPSPSPSTSTALSILNTQRKSRTKIEMIDITTPPSSPAPNNQQEIFYTPTSAVQLKRKSEQMLNGTKELSEIRQCSNAMNSIVKVPQLPSPSPSTSTALSILNTQRKSRTKIEMIDITTPPSSPAPNNQQEIFYTPTSAVLLKRKSEQMLNGTKVNVVYNL